MSADAKMVPVAWHIGPIFKLGSEKPGRFGADDSRWQPLYSADTIAALHEGLVSAEAEVAALRKDAERREGVVATLQETCEIYERRLSASEPVAALATRLSAARAAHNDLLCDPKATTVQFIGSRDRLLFTWAALDSAIAAKGK